jgi:hypothetical protein
MINGIIQLNTVDVIKIIIISFFTNNFEILLKLCTKTY